MSVTPFVPWLKMSCCSVPSDWFRPRPSCFAPPAALFAAAVLGRRGRIKLAPAASPNCSYVILRCIGNRRMTRRPPLG